jgi:hypothetical protein
MHAKADQAVFVGDGSPHPPQRLAAPAREPTIQLGRPHAQNQSQTPHIASLPSGVSFPLDLDLEKMRRTTDARIVTTHQSLAGNRYRSIGLIMDLL